MKPTADMLAQLANIEYAITALRNQLWNPAAHPHHIVEGCVFAITEVAVLRDLVTKEPTP